MQRENADRLLALGVERLEQNDYSGALRDLDRLLQIEPDNGDFKRLRLAVSERVRIQYLAGSLAGGAAATSVAAFLARAWALRQGESPSFFTYILLPLVLLLGLAVTAMVAEAFWKLRGPWSQDARLRRRLPAAACGLLILLLCLAGAAMPWAMRWVFLDLVYALAWRLGT